jgi:hypothetical protein
MTIQYTWDFSNIKIKKIDQQLNVVHSYTATVTGSLDEFSESREFEITTSSEKEIDNFVPFDQLTKEQFILWTECSLGMIIEGAKSDIKYKINDQIKKSQYTDIDPPWIN